MGQHAIYQRVSSLYHVVGLLRYGDCSLTAKCTVSAERRVLHQPDFGRSRRTDITTEVQCRGCRPDMSQRIGPFLAGVGVVTAAYISGRALIWDRAETISEVWPGGPPPKQPLPEATPFVAPQTKALMQQRWNAAVDNTFKPMIRFLSDRGL